MQIEGHNGIGKTSLLRILAGLAQPVEGKVRWNSDEITKQREEYHHQLLYLGHHSGVKPELTAWENLKFYQQISQSQQGTDILWDVLETVGLLGREDLPAAQLSAGQQKRIALARLWISEAPLWILDEPFTAIDKKGVEFLTALFLLVRAQLSLTQSHHKRINPNEFAYFVQDKQCVGFFQSHSFYLMADHQTKPLLVLGARYLQWFLIR